MATTLGSSTQFRRLDLEPINVVLILQQLKVQGTIHVEPKSHRFSDAWDNLVRERRKFFAITDATITTLDGTPVGTAEFMVVDKEEVRAAYPV
jgi:hypothetical protein